MKNDSEESENLYDIHSLYFKKCWKLCGKRQVLDGSKDFRVGYCFGHVDVMGVV